MYFKSIIDSSVASTSIQASIICTLVALVLGLIVAFVYMQQGKYTKNFVITLALLPALVQVVILAVNGNLGTSVAVLGTFSLVRFRSVPGTSKEITSIFLSMVIGVTCGMGQVVYAVIITLIMCLALLVLSKSKFGDKSELSKVLKITIPENLDYTGVFDDIFKQYTSSATLERVKTVNLGSMYELVYIVDLKEANTEKKMIDDIRCRNGNLSIVCSKNSDKNTEL